MEHSLENRGNLPQTPASGAPPSASAARDASRSREKGPNRPSFTGYLKVNGNFLHFVNGTQVPEFTNIYASQPQTLETEMKIMKDRGYMQKHGKARTEAIEQYVGAIRDIVSEGFTGALLCDGIWEHFKHGDHCPKLSGRVVVADRSRSQSQTRGPTLA
jgi:hypothetical protein